MACDDSVRLNPYRRGRFRGPKGGRECGEAGGEFRINVPIRHQSLDFSLQFSVSLRMCFTDQRFRPRFGHFYLYERFWGRSRCLLSRRSRVGGFQRSLGRLFRLRSAGFAFGAPQLDGVTERFIVLRRDRAIENGNVFELQFAAVIIFKQ